MKITDKIGSMYEITCGCSRIWQHHERIEKIFCQSCGMWGSLKELRNEEATKEYEIDKEVWSQGGNKEDE